MATLSSAPAVRVSPEKPDPVRESPARPPMRTFCMPVVTALPALYPTATL